MAKGQIFWVYQTIYNDTLDLKYYTKYKTFTFMTLGVGTQSFSSLFSPLHSAIFLFFLLEFPTPSSEQFTVVFTAIKVYPSINKKCVKRNYYNRQYKYLDKATRYSNMPFLIFNYLIE